ncbi:M23 family metallopeptidase [Gordonia sp. PDNC005]|uniref:M23 family metallopeptidase n=1 Tax=unclassified Gordonia (in: high G+C Gram-positive bacteria) TaxID=2657482 RepID=UPI00196371AA|nr:M23 family metallopeptidase [Gordonia sp. PDNC005]QRY63099.1 M23 family metallopeptidase [Gordonia sp. PDNC005]
MYPEADASAVVDAPVTRDIPVPSRALRLGLRSDDAAISNVRTTEIPVTDDDLSTPVTEAALAKSRAESKPSGRHRLRPPSSALKARTALVAIAAGAGAVAIVGSGVDQAAHVASAPEPAEASPELARSSDDLGPGITESDAAPDFSEFSNQLTQGKQIAAARAAADDAARRPMFVSPIAFGDYHLTSAFAPRWGTFHGGIDMAAPLGTPIHAVTDGVVVDAGPASGYGNWVQVKGADGTITMYGHMSSSGVKVTKGEKVTAGDVIALVGNEGFSTGPHVHVEVWIPKGGGYFKIDPAPWLAKHGVKLSALTG